MTMTNMKLSPDEAKDAADSCCATGEGDGPAYPYGLSINLDDKVLTKLGITTPPTVGTKLILHAMVEVTSNSQYENQSGKEANVNLQITDMDLEQAMRKDPAQVLYGKAQ
jgi:hypothetical protein